MDPWIEVVDVGLEYTDLSLVYRERLIYFMQGLVNDAILYGQKTRPRAC